jgi:hypothetical protein
VTGRVLLASLVALALAVLAGAQALSSASLRRAPELALSVFPWNGLAAEETAFRQLAAAAAPASPGKPRDSAPASLPRSADLARLADASKEAARAAIRREPLAARALVILALAENDAARRRSILGSTARLTRRDLSLQTLLIEEHSKARDYPATMAALDAMLRVHPEQREVFFPAMAKTLADQPAVIPAFARLLARPLPWRESFLGFAVTAPGAPDNLAALRGRIALDDGEFDRKLIARLAADGRFALAEQLYAKLSHTERDRDGAGAWSADYPPFDWQLTDQPGLRAQSGERPGTLEIAARPGNGGVVAARVMRNPGAPFVLALAHTVEPASQTGDLRLKVSCAGSTEPIFDQAFHGTASRFAIARLPSCAYLSVAISVRAWTGGRPVKAVLSPLDMAAATPAMQSGARR